MPFIPRHAGFSAMEIYNEHLTDLLGAKDDDNVLPRVDLREHPKKASLGMFAPRLARQHHLNTYQ